jgi:tripartite ATP-independent transporter DctM subunit
MMLEWWLLLLIVFGGLMLLIFLGMPVAFAFLLVNVGGAIFILGGEVGLQQLILNIKAVINFALCPVIFFIFMGEILFRSGIGSRLFDAVDMWIGHIPGRLSIATATTSVLFAAMSGSNMANTALMGRMMLPEMRKRGYKDSMSMGPIMGCGGLAMLIPPSALIVLLGGLTNESISKLLMGGVMPGLVMAGLYIAYILIRCTIQPSLAPSYEMPSIPLLQKINYATRYVLPAFIIIFSVIGSMLLGIATPSEAGALGALASLGVCLFSGYLSWNSLKKMTLSTIRTSAMLLMIVLASITFSQIIAFSGATAKLMTFVAKLPVHPVMVLIAMQSILMALGSLMDNLSMVMIALPIYLPVTKVLGFDQLWFLLLTLINMEVATVTPPFGLILFTMKAVAPPDVTMADIYRAAIPFIIIDTSVIVLAMAFPQIVLWLPGQMG